MKKNILTYGSIVGIILSINMVFMVNLMMSKASDPDFVGNDFLGYATMILLFSVLFFGIRNYRNNYLDGTISFGKAFKVGALIALIASTFYVVTWLFYYYLFVPDFMDFYTEYVLRTSPPEQLEAKTTEMASFKEMYKNPLVVIAVTYSEVLPVGLVVALVSAFIVKKK